MAAAVISVPAGRTGDRRDPVRVMTIGAVSLTAGYVWFAFGSHSPLVLAPCAETAQSAAVATLAPSELRGSAFGLLATAQAGANLIANAVAGVLWTALAPAAAFVFLAAAMLISVPLIATSGVQGSERGLT